MKIDLRRLEGVQVFAFSDSQPLKMHVGFTGKPCHVDEDAGGQVLADAFTAGPRADAFGREVPCCGTW